MISKVLRIAAIGDIHLGHPRTPTVHILKNLRKAFPDNEETGQLDIIFLEGDVFDRDIYLNDPNAFEIRAWINQFLRMCKRRDIMVRVLEGTPSHDWTQSREFISENENANIGCDLRYVKKLEIEYIERFGATVLYVPDEWRPDTDDTWVEVQQLLKEHTLEKVDFAVMHGAFNYQLPSHVHVPVHIPERYLSIVRHFIFIGHIHKSSQFERILAAGSFDRLSHNEEEPKGHMRVVVREGGNSEIVFVENKGAMLYKSINCTGIEIEKALQKVAAALNPPLPAGSYVRIVANKNDAIVADLDLLRKQYPDYTWQEKIAINMASEEATLNVLRSRFVPVDITPETIHQQVMDRLRSKVDRPQLLERCNELLQEVIQQHGKHSV